MAESYKFSGHSGLFFEELYSSQFSETKLEKAMAQVCPCLFYFDGKCKIKADTYASSEEAEDPGENLKTPCVGAKIRCDYYTGNFEYLIRKYVKDGKGILAEHIVELFKVYLNYQCSYEIVNTFAHEQGISTFWGEDKDPLNHRVVLPRRVFIDDDEIVSLPYHPTSFEYADDLNFVTDEFFKFLFPRVIYPLNLENTIYQGDSVSVLLDVPGKGYTYIIYLSELDLSEEVLDIIDNFFKTGDTVKRDAAGNVVRDSNDVLGLSYFFKSVFSGLKSKQDSKLIVECVEVGFGVTLATLLFKYDLSKCLIIHSEHKIIFNEEIFDLYKVSIGMADVSNIYGMIFDMSYCDVSFASNCIYDLATDYTLSVSYDDFDSTDPIINGDYKGQNLSFGTSVSVVGKQPDEESTEKEEISITALPLPWYYSDETNKKYLWSLKKEEKEYTINIDYGNNETEKEFELGKIIIFKNVVIICIEKVTFPFYIKNCTYNSYKYITKYQSYHPMLEYDVDPNFSFSVGCPSVSAVFSKESEILQQPNPDRSFEAQSKSESSPLEVMLLKSFPPGIVMLIPDIEENGEFFGDTVKLKFTVVKGGRVEYLLEVSTCEDKDLFIPNKCDSLEQFKFKDLIKEESYKKITKVEFEEEELTEEEQEAEDKNKIALSNLVEGQPNQKYYVEVIYDLEVDKGAGVIYKQVDLKSIYYFYFSYLGFKFLFDSVSEKTMVVEEKYDEINEINVRIEKEKKEGSEEEESEEKFDPKNSAIQKLLRGERPLLSVDDLNVSQEAVKGEGEDGQEAYDFKYLYEKTVRSYVNNRFYEPFKVDFLCSDIKGREWISLFADSVSDFYILNKLEEAKKPREADSPEPPTEIKHNLTHVLNAYRCFGMPICGFNKDKLKLDNDYQKSSEESIFDKLIMDNFECELDKIFYFYALSISKYIQDYIFFIKYKNIIVPILKRIPVIVSQVGLPDPEIKYEWKSEYDIYTHLCNTDLDPFTKVVDSNNPDFFVNPFYVIVHKDYREDKYRNEGDITDNRMASEDYSFMFTSNWWVKYKKDVDTYGRIEKINNRNLFLAAYRMLAKIGDEIPTEENIIKGFARGKAILYIELDSISYVYSSYCGDHDFSLGDTTPYLYDRVSDCPLVADNSINPYYTGNYDKNGIGMRKSRPCSRFVGPMWFPFRSCEVVRYSEFADYPGVRHVTDDQGNVHSRSLRGFSCTDLIFKPYDNEGVKFSDFKYLFIDDCFGSINPYRYSSSFYSTDTMYYYGLDSSTEMTEISPTYLPSNASIPWRFVPILFRKEDGVDYIVISEPRAYAVIPFSSVPESITDCVILDVKDYKDFEIDKINMTITKSEISEPGVVRSILYNCLRDIPPIPPYNYNRDKYICGYERMRAGDANFIYQCLYPYHHNYPYYSSCGCIYDYKHRGEDAYGPVENTLLPGIVSEAEEIKTIIHNSVFLPGIYCNGSAHGLYHLNMQRPLFAYDWLNPDVPIADLGCAGESDHFSPIATKNGIPWNRDNYMFWDNYDLLNGCETDGPQPMKICLNQYHNKDNDTDYIDSIFIDNDSSCSDVAFIDDSDKYSVINLTSEPLYYHFASTWEEAYDYVFLGATMQSKPVFYGEGALRMFKTHDDLKKSYFTFDKDKKINNIAALPVFGGLGKFFRMCYFSTYYGEVPFSTLSGVGDTADNDNNYVYKLSGHVNNDIVFNNVFKYGYLPERNLVFVTTDTSLFISMLSFTEDDTITLEVWDCVRFCDLVWYKEVESSEEGGYYKYRGGDEITIVTFGNDLPIESGPAFILIYDKKISAKEKYNYYSDYGFLVSIAEPIVGDMGVVIDPFPFGEQVRIECTSLLYSNGYLASDTIKLKLVGLGCCPVMHPCYMEIKVKENDSSDSSVPWKFYIESEEKVVNTDGEVEVQTIEIQQAYLHFHNGYKVGKLIQRDDDNTMSLNDIDVIKKGNTKYKINRGFYIDFSDMLLPYTTYTKQCWLQGLNTSEFFINRGISGVQDFCMCVDKGYSEQHPAAYIELTSDCFIISLEGRVFLSDKYEYETIIGYLALETSDEYYAIGNLVAYPEFDNSNKNIEDNGKYHYTLKFFPYSNYNKVKYGGTKYRLVFKYVTFFCSAYEDLYVDVEYGMFNGGVLAEIVFNKISSLKAITYSKSITETLQCNTEGIDLYNENLNDKLIESDSTVFYTMPFGFVHKLKGGILKDKQIKFKNGYNNEFASQIQAVNYSDDEQEFLDRITLPVERDVFGLIHYPTNFVRFCLKSKLYNISSETYVNFDMSLIPNLCNIFGYIPIPQWAAPGHKLDLYPDSFYGKERAIFTSFEAKDFDPGSFFTPIGLMGAMMAVDTFSTMSFSDEIYAFDKYFMDPYNLFFITHVDHGMFGYPDITNVSDWIKEPVKPTVYGIYDKDGNRINS